MSGVDIQISHILTLLHFIQRPLRHRGCYRDHHIECISLTEHLLHVASCGFHLSKHNRMKYSVQQKHPGTGQGGAELVKGKTRLPFIGSELICPQECRGRLRGLF